MQKIMHSSLNANMKATLVKFFSKEKALQQHNKYYSKMHCQGYNKFEQGKFYIKG